MCVVDLIFMLLFQSSLILQKLCVADLIFMLTLFPSSVILQKLCVVPALCYPTKTVCGGSWVEVSGTLKFHSNLHWRPFTKKEADYNFASLA